MSLLVVESSDDEEENDEEREKITANGRHYVESYLHSNEADRNEALNNALRARLKKQPRFLFRYVEELRLRLDSSFFLEESVGSR